MLYILHCGSVHVQPGRFLAILKNKNKPELLINIASGFNFCPNFSVNSTGDLLFLLPSIYDKDTQTVLRPILVIDIFRNAFSYIPTNNHNPCFKVVEIKENIFKIDADERQMKSDRRLKTLSRKKIRINRLKWYDLSNLHSLPDMLLRKNAFCSCCSKKETTH